MERLGGEVDPVVLCGVGVVVWVSDGVVEWS